VKDAVQDYIDHEDDPKQVRSDNDAATSENSVTSNTASLIQSGRNLDGFRLKPRPYALCHLSHLPAGARLHVLAQLSCLLRRPLVAGRPIEA